MQRNHKDEVNKLNDRHRKREAESDRTINQLKEDAVRREKEVQRERSDLEARHLNDRNKNAEDNARKDQQYRDDLKNLEDRNHAAMKECEEKHRRQLEEMHKKNDEDQKRFIQTLEALRSDNAANEKAH